MVKKSRGFRAKTRKKLRGKIRRSGITSFLQKFDVGENVVIFHNPSSHKGMPSPRLKGRVGKIVGRRGKGYILEILNGKKIKTIIVRAEHLRRL
jgi:large subunit ribosomal protein L21e